MSNKHHNHQSNKPVNQTNIDENTEDVTSGVTPVEGDNSINETEESNVDTVVSADQDVSVADTQESESIEQEDGSATTDENIDSDEKSQTEDQQTNVSTDDNLSIPAETEDEKKEDINTTPEVKQEDVKVNTVVSKDSGYLISLGVVTSDKMELVKTRLMKAGFNSASMFGDNLVVGPFNTMSECVASRKKIVAKGLKCRIIEK